MPAHDTAATGDGIRQRKGEVLDPTTTTARGAGANAASVLTSATPPSGSAGTISGTASSYNPIASASALVQQGLGGKSRSAMIGTQYDSVLARDQNDKSNKFEDPNGEENLARPHNSVQSYNYNSRVMTDPAGNDVNLSSPPRRRAKEAAPFLQAKGLTLTYAQAKLFGLHAACSPPTAGTLTKGGLEVAHAVNRRHGTWPGPGPQRTRNTASDSTGVGGSTRDGRGQQHRGHVRTYSPIRMERLARPLPGRDRVGRVTTGRKSGTDRPLMGGRGTENTAFTWKRSKRAEAAMR